MLDRTFLLLALIAGFSPTAPPQGDCVPAEIVTPLQGVQACLGETVVFTVKATGSDLQYAWTHGGILVPGETGPSITRTNITTADRGIWCVEVSNACSLVTSCTRLSISDCGGSYCTLTMGGWGNAGGHWNGMSRKQLITSLLAQGDLRLGQDGRSLLITPGIDSAQCIIDRLPATSRPTTLPDAGDLVLDSDSCQTNPPQPESQGRFKNVLLGQTLALALNLRLDPTISTLVVCTQMTTTNGVFQVSTDVIEAMATYGGGHGVANLLALANHALAGEFTGAASLGEITAAIAAVNEAFDECATLTGCD